MRSFQGAGRYLTQADVSNLAFLDQLGQATHSVLDWDGRIDPVNVVQVDTVDTEPLERGFAAAPNVIGGVIDAP
ncbi:hypothetical protein FQZ97_1228360 [compost metagenome]